MYTRSAATASLAALAASLVLTLGSLPAEAAEPAPRTFRIEAQDLGSALKAFAFQSQREIFFAPELIRGKQTHGVKGNHDDLAALNAILADTGLTYTITESNAILVRDAADRKTTATILQEIGQGDRKAQEGTGGYRAIHLTMQDPGAAGEAVAADSQQNPGDHAEITVTGSRIARRLGDGLLPTTTIDQKFVDERGYFNIGEAIDDLPMFSQSSNSDTDFNQNRADVGFTFVDLFGLGTQRTLTLVNGRRVPSSASPIGGRTAGAPGLQVDLNAIPSALVQRIETVTIGGAPIYGADAVAGTVNVILRDDFEGLDFDAQYGMTDESDVKHYRLRGLYGTSFMNQRGNITFAAEYSNREGLRQTDRPGANDIHTSPLMGAPGGPVQTYQRNTGFPGLSAFGVPTSSLTAIAGVTAGGPLGFAVNGAGQPLAFNAAGDLVPIPLGDPNGTTVLTQDQPDFPGLYRLRDHVALLNESERLTLSTIGHLDLTAAVRATFRVNYSDLQARQPIGEPVFRFADLPTSVNNPFLSAASRATLLGADTAGVPAAFIADPGGTFFLGKTLDEISEQGGMADSRNWSAVLGLDGDVNIAGRPLRWDLNYSRGTVDTENSVIGIFAAGFNQAADAVMVNSSGAIITDSALYAPPGSFSFDAAASGFVNTGAGQRIWCRGRVTNAASACLPFNIFGAGNPAAVLDSVSGRSILRTTIDQQYAQANLTGELVTLPAGALSFGIGAEWREEKSAFAADADTAAGRFSQVTATPPVKGEFTSKEYYAETIVPVLTGDMMQRTMNVRLFDSLQFEGAYRIIDNSQAGTDDVWTLGGRLRFNDSLMLRGNRTRSVRAPSVTEFFSGMTPQFLGFPDPCQSGIIDTGPNPAMRRANCIADVIARGLAANQAGAEAFLAGYVGEILGINGSIGGNPDLDNETADAWTLGLMLTPDFLPDFAASFDWNRIRIEGAITSRSGSQVIADCYDNSAFPGAAVCSQFTRNPANFFINSFRGGFVNVGFIDFEALTSNLQYSFALGSAGNLGRIALSNMFIYLDRYDISVNGVAVSDSVDLIGREKFRDQLALSYSRGPFTAIWAANYTQGAYVSESDRDGTTDFFEFDHTRDLTTHNLSVLYDLNSDISLRLIVNNIFEGDQVVQLRQFSNIDSRQGRSFFAGLSARF